MEEEDEEEEEEEQEEEEEEEEEVQGGTCTFSIQRLGEGTSNYLLCETPVLWTTATKGLRLATRMIRPVQRHHDQNSEPRPKAAKKALRHSRKTRATTAKPVSSTVTFVFVVAGGSCDESA